MIFFQGGFINRDSMGFPQLLRAIDSWIQEESHEVICCHTLWLARIPITTVVKFSLKVSSNENDSDFILDVCCSFSGTGWKRTMFTNTWWHSGSSSGQANLSGLLERQLGETAVEGIGFYSNTTPFFSTHNCTSKSCLFQDIFTGKTLCQPSFFTGMDFLLYSPWKWLT